jgi:amino acid transporter
MIVVPKSDQMNPSLNVAQQFFHLTFGKIAGNRVDPQRILSAFIAISSFGNIVVMTFAAARSMFPKCRLTVPITLLTEIQSNKKLPRKAFYHGLNSSAPARMCPSGGF